MNGDFSPAPFQATFSPSATSTAMQSQPGLFSRMAHGITSPFTYAAKAIGNTAAGMTGALTNNPVAEHNAYLANKKVMGTGTGNIVKRAVGNDVQLGTMLLAPEVGGGASIGSRIATGALQGALYGGGAAAANDGNAGDIVKGTLTGGATGGAVGGVLGLAGKAAGGVMNKAAASTSAKEAAATAADLAPYEHVAQGADVQGMHNLFTKQLGTDVAPETVQKVSGLLTGHDGFINGTKQQLIANSGPVDVSGLDKVIQEAAQSTENAGALGEPLSKGTAGNSIYNGLLRENQALLSPGDEGGLVGGKINVNQASPEAVFQKIQELDGRLQNGRSGEIGQATQNVMRTYRNALMDRLSNGTGLNDAIKSYTVPAEDVAAFHDAVQQAGLPANVADYGINAVNKAQSLGDLRAAEAPLVKANQLASNATDYAGGKGFIQGARQAAGMSTGEGGDVIPQPSYGNARMFGFLGAPGMRGVASAGYLGAKALNNVVGSDLAVKAVEVGKNATSSIPGQIGSHLAVPAAVSAGGVGQPAAPAPVENNLQPPSLQTNALETKTTAPVANPPGLTSATIEQAMLVDMAHGGKHISQLNELNNMVKAQQAQANPKLTQTSVNQANTTQRALNGLQNIQTAFGSTGETGNGALSRILGTTVKGVGLPGGGGARDVNTAISSAIPDVAKALGLGTSAAELKQVAALLPSVGDSPATAQKKIQRLNDQISSYAQQYFTNQSNFVNNGNESPAVTSFLGGLGVGQ